MRELWDMKEAAIEEFPDLVGVVSVGMVERAE